MPRRGDVTCGEDPGHARLEALVDEDSIADVEPGSRCEQRARLCAHADDDEIALGTEVGSTYRDLAIRDAATKAHRVVVVGGGWVGGLRSLSGLVDVLRGAGYEPRLEPDDKVCLRNCPYKSLAVAHRGLTCGINLAWAEGLVGGLGLRDMTVELAPEPGRCCVVFHEVAEPVGKGEARADRNRERCVIVRRQSGR